MAMKVRQAKGKTMSPVDEKVIELSKKKILLLSFVACAFVVLGAWLLSLDEAAIQSQFRPYNPMLIYGIGLASIVVFGVCGVFGIKQLFDKKAGLVFNSFGVFDNSSAVSAGLIPWSEIVGAEIVKIHTEQFLIIKVRDPGKYIARGGALKQAFNKANYKMGGSPIAITSIALKIKLSEVLALFHEYKQKYGHA